MNYSLKDILDNREIAMLIWLGIFILWILSKKETRKHIAPLLKTLTGKVIAIPLTLMTLYVCLLIYFLMNLGFWDFSYLSVTVIWFIGVAISMFVNAPHLTESGSFKDVIWDNLKITAFIEFIANLYVFNFWVEFFFVIPFSVILGGLLGVASVKYKDQKTESCLKTSAVILGASFLIYALFRIISDFQGFASLYNLKEFILPFIFTVALLPFIYILALYVTHSSIYMRLDRLIKDKALARYAKRKTAFAFNFNLKLLHKWARRIYTLNFDSKESIIKAIGELKKNGG